MNLLRALTIIFSFLIVIPVGVGMLPMVVLEVSIVMDIFLGNLDFSQSGSNWLETEALISMAGQLILISSFFFDKKIKSAATIVGCITILTAIFILSKSTFNFNTGFFQLMLSLPFIVTAVVLLIIQVTEWRANKI